MRIALLATNDQWDELHADTSANEWLRVTDISQLVNTTADVFINLLNDAAEQDYLYINKPVIINSVLKTLKEININNGIRINSWDSFLQRGRWEVAGNITDELKDLFKAIKKEYVVVPDEPGFIAARIIAMIINEAYFAIEDNVSTKEEINIAMKLGTNHPYGPFEWCEKIGIQNIYLLLQKLSHRDKRYIPSTLLQQEAMI